MSGRADGGSSGGGGTGTLAPVDEIAVADRRVSEPYKREENPTNQGNALWLRKWKLSLGPKSSIPPEGAAKIDAPEKALAFDLSDLDFSFEVNSSTQAHPSAIAKIRVYNVNPEILTKLQELVTVYLEAGYQPPSTQYGVIFQGEIVYYQYGQQPNAVDTVLDIHAFQDERPLDWAIVNTTLSPGHTKLDVVKAAADAMGVPLGQITDLGDEKSPRSRTLYGMARDVLREISETAHAQTFLGKDGKLNVLGRNEPLQMKNVQVPVLNARSGLIGVPVVTLGKGVNVRSLLNPAILPGGQIKVDQKGGSQILPMNLTRFIQQGFSAEVHKDNVKATSDGYYRVVTVIHSGEIRSNAWFTNAITESFDPTEAPPTLRPSA